MDVVINNPMYVEKYLGIRRGMCDIGVRTLRTFNRIKNLWDWHINPTRFPKNKIEQHSANCLVRSVQGHYILSDYTRKGLCMSLATCVCRISNRDSFLCLFNYPNTAGKKGYEFNYK